MREALAQATRSRGGTPARRDADEPAAWRNAALLALVAIVPLVVLTLTSFVKLSVVLSLVRNAIGAPDAPSGLVVTGLALVLTFFVMAPVAIDMVHAARRPRRAPRQRPAPRDALDGALRDARAGRVPGRSSTPPSARLEPLRAFLAQARRRRRIATTFVELAQRSSARRRAATSCGCSRRRS